jgi:hypothetical protein
MDVPAEMVTKSELVGTPVGVQFAELCQSAETEPVQVLLAASADRCNVKSDTTNTHIRVVRIIVSFPTIIRDNKKTR